MAATPIPNYGLLTTSLTAVTQKKVQLLADPSLNMLSLQPGTGVSASMGFEGTEAAATVPTNHLDAPFADVPIPRDPTSGARITYVYLWSSAGGSVNLIQYSSNPT
jgi:hypothetical protein